MLAALTAVDTTDGPEIQLLKDSFQKTERSAQERPIAVQLIQSEAFVERARKRLVVHDADRQQLVIVLVVSCVSRS